MLKKYSMLILFSIMISIGIANAESNVQLIQSPIYTDDIGRAHFLGRGGYSSTRNMQMGEAYNSAINEVSQDMQRSQKEVKEKLDNPDIDITSVINERKDVNTSKTKASFTSDKRIMDPTASFGQGSTYLPSSNLNNSKTIYKDDIGRLHFFGKGNLIKE